MRTLLAALALGAALAPPPQTARRPVADAYHGVSVVDPYRWLEDGKSPEVRAWSKAQDARTRSWLASLPDAPAIRARTRELLRSSPPRFYALDASSGPVFALEFAPPRQQPALVAFSDPADAATRRTVVDPLALDPSGKTAIDWYVPSLDGRRVAVSLSSGGTEEGALSVFDVATGQALPDRIPRVNGNGGGSVAWLPGGDSLLYTRYPREGERPAAELRFHEEVWLHRLGDDPSKDAYVLGRESADPRIAEHALRISDDGRWVSDLVEKGDGGEYELFVRTPAGAVKRVAALADRIVAAKFGADGALYLLSRKDAPRGRILRLPLEGDAAPELAAAKPVAEASADGAIQDYEAAADRLLVVEISGGPSRVRVLSGGREAAELPILPVSTVGEVHRTRSGAVLVQNESFVDPPTWLRFDPAAAAPARLPISTRAAVDFSDVEVVRDFATSKDGTKVPLSIVRPKGTRLDGRNPTILWGYGGYGINEVPRWSPSRKLLLEAGVVFVVAHIRGGGEYGDEWHRAGNLTKKQNVFDDFAAAARRLVETRVTSPERLALQGGSNGGLLVGAVVTQHPELARTAVAMVGVFDMLRVELHPNGAFNVTEYGTVKDPAEFRALLGYSPYHHVRAGTRYPALLLTAGDADPRVDAYHARKMTARLQAASASGLPILLRVSGLGHGIGSPLDEIIDERADVAAFFFRELGVRYPPAAAKAPAKGAAGERG